MRTRFCELLPFTGQSAALVDDVAPAAAVVRRLMQETEAALDRLRLL